MSRRDTDRPASRGVVLVIEHEPAVAELARRYLVRDGLTVVVAGDPAEAAAAITAVPPPAGQAAAAPGPRPRTPRPQILPSQGPGPQTRASQGPGPHRPGPQAPSATRPDVVVLDLTMPGLAPGVVRRKLAVRGQAGPPQLLCLEGPGGLRPRHVGITGDRDLRCLRRPFSPRLLTARVRALLREHPPAAAGAAAPAGPAAPAGSAAPPAPPAPPGIAAGGLVLDAATLRVRAGGVETRLTKSEFSLLAFLAGHAGRVFTRRQLLDAAWAPGTAASTRAVDVQVASLRAKLGAGCPIRTVRGVGYAVRR